MRDTPGLDTGGQPAGRADEPALAIVIPVFRHPVLMVEAIEAALAQRTHFAFRVVVVDDGCPLEETRAVASAFALADPRLVYLRKPNGGLSSARNHGIDMALAAWPSLRAVYLLDADNRLSPSAMQSALDLLDGCPPEVGWIYPHIDKFGMEWSGNYAAAYSRLLHVAFDNICEAGSLVSRRVLDAGIRFDETMKAGYEDWEFFLQCVAAGFVGRSHAGLGLQYRQRAESMVRDSHRTRGAILDHIRRKHARLFDARTLLRFEHEEVPRYALFGGGDAPVLLFTDPDLPMRAMLMEAFARDFAAEAAEPESIGTPPFLLWLAPGVMEALRQRGILHNVLWHMQRGAETQHAVALHLAGDPARLALEVDDGPGEAPPHGWMMRQPLFHDCVRDPDPTWLGWALEGVQGTYLRRLTLHGPFATVPEAAPPSPRETHARLRAGMPALRRRWYWRSSDMLPERRLYHARLSHALGTAAVTPRTRRDQRLDLGFALPIARFGGVERVAFAVARALREAGARTHLFLLGEPECELVGDLGASFDTVHMLADPGFPLGGGPRRFMAHEIALAGDFDASAPHVLGLLQGLDVLVCAHTAALSALVGELRRGGVRVIDHVHVLDRTPAGREVGHPYLGLAFEHAYDLFLTCSRQLAAWLHGHGVPAEKTLVIPNAADTRLPPPLVANALARRQARPAGPLRVLFLGRLDTQKGIERLERTLRLARLQGLPLRWRVVGGSVIEPGGEDWPGRFAALGVQVEQPVHDGDALAGLLAEADLLLLPSRWEGAPLVLIEAQRVGCVPLATRVGAVDELVEDGVDGLLVPDGADHAVAAGFAAALEVLCRDRDRLALLRDGAIRRGGAASWAASVAPLIARLKAWYPSARLGDDAPVK